MNDETLAPCPFCGKQPEYKRESTHWTGQRSVVLAVELGCIESDMQKGFHHVTVKAKTEQEAIEEWNKRHV
jgi:Lar family restriction alleviation protein